MNDPVSRELEQRLGQPLRWRSALAVAVGIHLVVALALVLGPSGRHRVLTLPHVQVRLTASLPSPQGAGPRARSAPVPKAAPSPKSPAVPRTKPPVPAHRTDTTSTKPAKKQSVTSRKKVTAPGKKPVAESTAAKASPEQTAAGLKPAVEAPAAAGGGGGVGLGTSDTGATDESFPYAYYLNRVLAIIESNWFRPPAAPGTRTRVLCRIDRAGRLVEAGIEAPSSAPAFDRAALRAVYASVPLPPLPQGYSGSTLTLHLEFGP